MAKNKKPDPLDAEKLKEFDITDVLFKSLAKLLQEGQVQIDVHLYPQFSSLLDERKVTYDYFESDNIFKLKQLCTT